MSALAATVAEGLVWSGAGLIVGYTLGSITRRAAEDDHRPGGRWWRVRPHTLRSIVGLAILVMAALTMIVSYRATACQAEYNHEVEANARQRDEAFIAVHHAQQLLITSGRNPATDAAYLAALDEVIDTLHRHPVPPAPDCRVL